MKKNLLLLLAMFSVFGAVAQSRTVLKEEYLSSINENWFLKVSAGAEFRPFSYYPVNPLFDVDNAARFGFSAGKWVNPYLAFRATLAYSTLSGESVSGMSHFLYDGQTSYKGGICSFGVDVMTNLSNIIGDYNPDRFYTIKPFLGLEADYSYSTNDKSENVWEYFPLIGIDNEFKVSKAFSVNLEVAAGITDVNMYGEIERARYAWPIRTSLGLTYYLGKGKARYFRKAVSSEHYTALQAINQSLNSDLDKAKKSVYTLTRDNKALQRDIEDLKAQKAGTTERIVDIAPVAMFFKIDKSNVDKENVARLKYVAEFLKEQPDVKFVVEGYADSATGRAEYNQKLSQKRADAVCKVLVDTYGVNSSQIEAVGKGAVDYLFESIDLNRAVVISTK